MVQGRSLGSEKAAHAEGHGIRNDVDRCSWEKEPCAFYKGGTDETGPLAQYFVLRKKDPSNSFPTYEISWGPGRLA